MKPSLSKHLNQRSKLFLKVLFQNDELHEAWWREPENHMKSGNLPFKTKASILPFAREEEQEGVQNDIKINSRK